MVSRGRTACLRAVHWPEFSINALFLIASAISSLKIVETKVLGPPVLEMVFGSIDFSASATLRLPVK